MRVVCAWLVVLARVANGACCPACRVPPTRPPPPAPLGLAPARSDGAIASVAQCEGLEELVLAVCNAVTIRGLGVLSRLHRLRRLDLSYTPLEVGGAGGAPCCNVCVCGGWWGRWGIL